MADTLLQTGNQAVQNTMTPDQQSLANNASIPAGQANSPWSPTSTAATVMTPGQAFNNNPLPIAPPAPSQVPTANAIVGGADATSKSLQGFADSLATPKSAIDNSQQAVLDEIARLTGTEAGKGQDQLSAENAAGIPGLQKNLQDINNELTTKNAEYQSLYAHLGGNGSVETAGVLAAQQGGLQIAHAADVGLISARAQAAQGNLALAQNTVNRSIDLKYSDIEAKINTQKAQLAALQPSLDKQQQIQAKAQELYLNQQAQDIADKKADAKTNISTALSQGVSTNFANQNGKFFDARTGEAFATPADFFKAAGVKSFDEAYQKGLVTDITQNKIDDRSFVLQARTKYPDAGITPNDTADQARAKLQNSAMYRKDTYIAPNAYTGGHTVYTPGVDPIADSWVQNFKNGNVTMTQVPKVYQDAVSQASVQGTAVVDPSTDQQVRAIINANPGEYGHAADLINKIQPGLADKYDAQLKSVYNDKKDINTAFNSSFYSPLALSRYTRVATGITKNFIDLPAYQAAAQSQVYAPRLNSAIQNPGSIGDAELLDTIVKINTSGNSVTDSQVHLVTGYQSYADQLNVFKNKLDSKGGALSDDQRKELYGIATQTMQGIQKQYQPIYDQAIQQLQGAGVPQSLWNIPDLNALSAAAQTSNSDGGGTIEYNGKQYKTDSQGNFDPNSPLTDAGSGANNAQSKTLTSAHPSPYGIIGGFDISSYATDPNHERNVYSLYNKIPQVNGPASIDSYIRSVASNSPIKGSDVMDAARAYNVDPKLVVALMQQDSSLGTKGKAVGTNNPGNVGNTDDGSTVKFKSVRDGVFAVAKNLSKRRTNAA